MTGKILVKLADPDAVPPSKAHPEDVGYDLTVISLVKSISANTFMYDTGIQVAPSSNSTYIEIVPRSSIYKHGFILANSIGIIDPNYRGTLKVVLTKVDHSLPNFSLPYTGFQLIVRKVNDIPLEITDLSLDITDRGDGGFGSTSK